MNTLKVCLYLTVFLKTIYFILWLVRLYVEHKTPHDKPFLKTLDIWEKRSEFIFIILFALILLYLFSPFNNILIKTDNHVKSLLYLNAFLLLFISCKNY